MLEWVTTIEYEDEQLKVPGQIDIDAKQTIKPKSVRLKTVKRVSNNASIQKSDSAWLKKENSAAHQDTGLLHKCKSLLMMLGVVCLVLLFLRVFR